MKSMKSEDLSKDLQVNLRISPQTMKDFMMNWMNRIEKIKDNGTRSVFRKIQLSIEHITLQFWEESGTVRGDCVNGNLSKRHTDSQTKQMNEPSDPTRI